MHNPYSAIAAQGQGQVVGYRVVLISCLLHISFTPGRIFMKILSNVRLTEMMGKTDG